MIDQGYGRTAGFIDGSCPTRPPRNTSSRCSARWVPWGIPYTDMDCELWVIFAKSKNQDLCKEWLKLFFTKEMYLNYVAQYPSTCRRSSSRCGATLTIGPCPDLQEVAQLGPPAGDVHRPGPGYSGRRLLPGDNIQIPFLAEVFDSGIIADEIVGDVQGRRNVKDAAQRIQDRTTDLIRKLRYPVPDPIRAEKKA